MKYIIKNLDVRDFELVYSVVKTVYNAVCEKITVFNENNGFVEEISLAKLKLLLEEESLTYVGSDEIIVYNKDDSKIFIVIIHEDFAMLDVDENLLNKLKELYVFEFEKWHE